MSSWVLYVDESGSDEAEGSLLVVAGVLVGQGDAPRADLDTALREFAVRCLPAMPYPAHARELNHTGTLVVHAMSRVQRGEEVPPAVRAVGELGLRALGEGRGQYHAAVRQFVGDAKLKADASRGIERWIGSLPELHEPVAQLRALVDDGRRVLFREALTGAGAPVRLVSVAARVTWESAGVLYGQLVGVLLRRVRALLAASGQAAAVEILLSGRGAGDHGLHPGEHLDDLVRLVSDAAATPVPSDSAAPQLWPAEPVPWGPAMSPWFVLADQLANVLHSATRGSPRARTLAYLEGTVRQRLGIGLETPVAWSTHSVPFAGGGEPSTTLIEAVMGGSEALPLAPTRIPAAWPAWEREQVSRWVNALERRVG